MKSVLVSAAVMLMMVPLLAVATPSLQFFSLLPFTLEPRHIQGIESWFTFAEPSEIHFFAEDDEHCAAAATHFPQVECHALPPSCTHEETKRPCMSCIFQRAETVLTSDWLMFINADIALGDETLLFSISLETLERSVHQDIVLVGRRWDVNGTHIPLATDPAPVLHGPYGLDYFIYRRNKLPLHEMPPFLSGVWRWDTWLLVRIQRLRHVRVIDVTSAVQALHLDPVRSVSHRAREGSAYADDLFLRAVGSRFQKLAVSIARIDMADYVLVKRDERFALATNTKLLVDAWRHASADGFVAMIVVNRGYITMFENFKCFADQIGFTEYIVIAEDLVTARTLRKLGITATSLESPSSLAKNGSLSTLTSSVPYDYGSLEFQYMMLKRTELVYNLLTHGFSPMILDADILFLEHPLPYLNISCHLQGQPHKGDQISGGLLTIQSNSKGIAFWRHVLECQRDNVKYLEPRYAEAAALNKTVSRGDYALHTEQECIKTASRKLEKEGELTICFLPESKFVDGKAFYDLHTPQLSGQYPVAIHNNWLVGAQNKITRMRDWGFWHLQETDSVAAASASAAGEASQEAPRSQCTTVLGGQPQFGILPTETQGEYIVPDAALFKLKIRILTMNRPWSLERLLRSLLAADYQGRKDVELEILIDAGPASDSNRTLVVNMAQSFEWPHGDYKPILQSESTGLIGQWLHDPGLAHDSHMILILEDDLTVSPLFFQMIQRTVDAYYFSPRNHDPRLYGISLQSQHAIVGETKKQRYGSIKIADRVKDDGHVFFYQLISSWGQVFFKRPWEEFIDWYGQATSDTLSPLVPCIPTFITNHYWKRSQGKVWTPLFVFWSFYKGNYNLYLSNLGGDLVVNHKEKGLNFQATQTIDASSSLLTNIDLLPTTFTQASHVHLYDFHMNRIEERNALLLRSALFTNLTMEERCSSFTGGG